MVPYRMRNASLDEAAQFFWRGYVLHIVLLSSGSGKRLWSLSNDIRSKQFIPLFPQMDGAYLSMVQRVFRQIRNVD